MRRWAAAIAVVLGGVALAWVVPGLGELGITIDEPQYFFSVERIQAWYSQLAADPAHALRDSVVQAAWDPPASRYFNPHPPAYKQLMALTEAVAGPWLGSVAGYRLAPAIEFALLVTAVVLVGTTIAGLSGGLGAGVALLAMPRLVGHAHIAATDMPLTLFWFVGVMGFAQHSLLRSRRFLLLGGLGLGLAMATKFTGWLLPLSVLPWCLLERKWRGVVTWLAVGLLVAWLVTPAAWLHPVRQLSALFTESLTRESHTAVSTRYLGVNYGYVVPWHHPFVLTMITVPLGVLALSAAGVGSFVFDKVRTRRTDPYERLRGALSGLLVLQVVFFLALMAIPQSPNHDGVRQWLPMFPFVALLAGLGLSAGMRLLAGRTSRRVRTGVGIALGGLCLVPGLLQAYRISPFFLSYYNGLVGGLPGAAAEGFEISYWADSLTPELLRAAERFIPVEAEVLAHPSKRYFDELQELGLLRRDLRSVSFRNAGASEAAYVLLVARMSFLPDPVRVAYERGAPLVSTTLDGVILAGLFRPPGPSHDDTTPDASTEVEE